MSAGTFPGLFQARAALDPDATAIVCGDRSLTYGELSARATRLARRLVSRGVGPEVRVGLVVERSIEAIVALIGILEAGGAYVPLDPELPRRRLAFLMDDAAPAVIVTTAHLRTTPWPASAQIVVVDEDEADIAGCDGGTDPRSGPPDARDLAYLIYTSGSTGAPKGVLVEHEGLGALATSLVAELDVRPGDRCLQFASLSFDASLFEIVPALVGGAALHLAMGEARASGPALARLLREQAITHTALLSSVLSLVPSADLPALRVVVSGGERCPAELAARWLPGRRFFNTYGPTEATVSATLGEHMDASAPPPLGRALPGVVVRVLADGEIAIGGVGLARGYHRRPEITAARFVADPSAPGARLYRTGDYGRFREDGQLEFLGRRDAQVKVRGFRVEPAEIEATLREHPAIDAAAVGVRDGRLVAWVASGAPPLAELRRFLEERLPAYMVPATFVTFPSLALLGGGKLDRATLPSPSAARPELETAFVAPRTPVEEEIAATFAAVLRVAPVGVEDDFFALGGDSLAAARIVARLREASIVTTVGALLASRTVAELSAIAVGAAPDRIPARPDAAEAPLSSVQMQLWLHHELDPRSAAYNLPAVVRLRGPLDATALAWSLSALAARHAVLRTAIGRRDGEPIQRALAAAPIALPRADLSAVPAADREARLAAAVAAEAAQPFALDRAPLLRARLFRLDAEDHALVVVLHHLICDGASMRVLTADLAAMLEGSALAPLPLAYGDYAAWQRRHVAGEALAAGLDFWKKELAGAPPRIHLPADRPRPPVPSFRGGRLPFSVPEADVRALGTLARSRGATLFMVVLAGFAVALRAHAGADDMVIGTTVAGRDRRELDGVVGHFANTIALRVEARDELRFGEHLEGVRARVLRAQAHADVPFGEVVAALRPARDPAWNPLFQVTFGLHPAAPVLTSGPLSITLVELHADASPFDLSLHLWEGAGALTGEILYATDLFDAATVAGLAARLGEVLARVAAQPDTGVDALARLGAPPEVAACAAVEAAVLEEPTVEDCAVRLRATDGRAPARVAYVVTSDPVTPARLSRRLDARIPAALRPDVYVPVAVVPRGPRGRVDEDALARVAVLDEDLRRRWEEQLRADPGVRDAAVTLHEVRDRAPRLHVFRLLPGHERGRARLPAEAFGPEAVAAPQASPHRPLAISAGEPLAIPEGAPATLVEALVRAAAGPRGVRYVEMDGSIVSQGYAALLAEARALLAGLADRGVRAGDRVILHTASNRDHLTAFWACLLGGVRPVTIAVAPSYDAPNGVLTKLCGIWEALGRPAVLTSRALLAPLRGLSRFLPVAEMRALAVDDLRGDLAVAPRHDPAPDDVAFFQLSSGSTGLPKIIQETHRGVLAHAHAAVQRSGYGPGDVTLNWIPFDHVVPILTCHLKDVIVGCEQIHVKAERVLGDPLSWLDLVERFHVTHTWSPNFGLKLLADAIAAAPGRSWDLSSLRYFMNAGEQVTLPAARELLRLTAPFGVTPRAIQPAFGMAEAGTIVSAQNDFDCARGVHHVAKASLGGPLEIWDAEDASTLAFVDLGPPVPGVKLRIADAENRTLPEAVIGRLQLAGPVITPGYLDNPDADRDAFVGEGWFNTGDLGFIIGGRLTVTGREKEVIIVRGANFHCHEIEEVADRVAGVEPTFVAACAALDPGGATEGLAIFFVPRDPAAAALTAAAVRAEVTRRIGVAPIHVLPLPRAEFPKTTSGKIQRVALSRALAKGELDAAVEALDLQLGNERTVPDWFYRPEWRRRDARPGDRRAGVCLIVADVADAGGLADRLRHRLACEGRLAIVVEPGAALDGHGPIASVVGLSTWGDDPRGVAGALSLLQALARRGDGGALVRVLLVSSGAEPVLPDEPIAWEKAPVSPLVAVASRELPFLDCRHVDLEGRDGESDAALVARELTAATRDRHVAYRGGARFVAGLRRVDPAGLPAAAPPFVDGGAYVLSGGLGGIGVALARHLLEHHRARLLLLGRTPLDELPRDRAEAHAGLLLAAARWGGEVVYATADVADAARVAEVGALFEARCGRAIDGVLHLAATFAERPLIDEPADGFAAALSARARGAVALHRLVDGRPQALFVAFSSVNAFFGGHAAGAYAAQSRLVEHFVREQRRAGRSRACSVAWSAWDGIGMSRDSATHHAARARGFAPVRLAEGMVSLLAALHRDAPCLIVGLDGQSHGVARYLPDRLGDAAELTAYVAGAPPDVTPRDRHGTPAPFRVVPVERVARTPDGRVDLHALDPGASPGRPPHVSPESEAEETLAAIWRELLGVDRVGVNENFFDLGGHSLLVAQVRARIHAAFGRDVPSVDLFRHPTVRSLAAHLAADRSEAPSGVEERARRQREARERRQASGVRATPARNDG